MEQAWVAKYSGPDSDWEEAGGRVVRDDYVHVTGFTHAIRRRADVGEERDCPGQLLWSPL